MKTFWYIMSGVMVANGVAMLLLRNYFAGVMFIAIGVGWIALRRWRLRRDASKTFD